MNKFNLTPEQIGGRVDTIRRSRKLTQEDFAEIIGYDVRTIRRWFKDGIDKITTICDCADALGVALVDILF